MFAKLPDVRITGGNLLKIEIPRPHPKLTESEEGLEMPVYRVLVCALRWLKVGLSRQTGWYMVHHVTVWGWWVQQGEHLGTGLYT